MKNGVAVTDVTPLIEQFRGRQQPAWRSIEACEWPDD
jgi:hypothetical protein